MEGEIVQHGRRWRCDRSKNGAKPFKSDPYGFEPAAPELEGFQLKKHLKASVTEPPTSEWAAPVLFVPELKANYAFA